jgi:isopentenyl diphosphate isomerase/L-lactate dehydrogenase-like FMN-dependent dehydrogenase
MKHITCIEDLRQLHKRRVPKAFFDYVDRGSYSEDTLRANRADLEAIKFRQRVLVDVSKRDLSTTILGEPASMPLILAPVGLLGMQHGDGEIVARVDAKGHFAFADFQHSQDLITHSNRISDTQFDAGKFDRRLTHEDLLA